MPRAAAAPDVDTDVAIVGAGPAGLLIAELLAGAGVRCAVLEAGPFVNGARGASTLRHAAMVHEHPDAAVWEARLTGLSDAAAAMPGAWARVRAVGGRSLLWSGCCARFTEASFADARAVGAPWPVGLPELEPFYRIAERRFGVRKGRSRLTAIERALGIAVEPRQTALLAGRVRTALSMARGKRRVVAEAIVRRILWDEQGATRGVEFTDARGRTRRARARVVVLCASPVESVRLVLTDAPPAISDRGALIGRGLVDHLHAIVIAIAPVPVKRASRGGGASFIPRFVNLGKQSQRAYVGGFSTEAQGPIAATELDPAWIPILGMSPRQALASSFYSVGVLGDALPHRERFVELHPRDKDALGRAVPVVHQAWSDNDRRMADDMMEAAVAAIDAMSPAGSVIVPFRDPRRHRGLFHEAGGLAMGSDPKISVTDEWGRIRGTRGLYVADASTFPTGGDRHPTLTILALAARTAHHIIQSARRGEP